MLLPRMLRAAYAAGMNEHIAKPLEFERLTRDFKKMAGIILDNYNEIVYYNFS